jgi:hypothetical protein
MASTSPNSSLSAPPANPPTHAHDQLTTLPPEIIQQISSYLYASHIPDREIHQIDAHYAGTPYKQPQTRDLSNLSRTSKTLYQQTHAWAHLFLYTHRAVTKYRVFKTPKAAAKQQPALQKLLQWSVRNCVFCGKTSQREAILMNGLHCCRGCDREQWPEKITETEARKQVKSSGYRFSMMKGYMVTGSKAPGVEKLSYGTYLCMGVCTTMYLRKDVEAYVAAMRAEGVEPVLEKRARRLERVKAMEDRRNMPVAIEDDGDEEDDEDDGDSVEVVVKGGAVFEEPIVVDDD